MKKIQPKQKRMPRNFFGTTKYPKPLRIMNTEDNLSAKVSEELKPVFKVIYDLDKMIARQFARLDKQVQMRSARGIVAHLRAYAKNECNPDLYAIKEIISDAATGKFIFEDNARERTMPRELETRSYFEVYK